MEVSTPHKMLGLHETIMDVVDVMCANNIVVDVAALIGFRADCASDGNVLRPAESEYRMSESNSPTAGVY